MSSSNYILEDAKKAYQELSTSNSLGIILIIKMKRLKEQYKSITIQLKPL